jgi:hypothetical protein
LLALRAEWKVFVIDSLFNVFFRCGHPRTSFPRRPAAKPGEPGEEMYVVCLDCGKRFRYDWERMRIGPEILSPGQAPPPARPRPRLRYLVAFSTLPLVWLIGKATRGKHSKSGKGK